MLEAVDEGLSLLGESVKHIMYFRSENDFKISKDDVPCRIEDFADALEKMFDVGAKFIEIQIMNRLYENVRGSSMF